MSMYIPMCYLLINNQFWMSLVLVVFQSNLSFSWLKQHSVALSNELGVIYMFVVHIYGCIGVGLIRPVQVDL